jgi:hypothetical protein
MTSIEALLNHTVPGTPEVSRNSSIEIKNQLSLSALSSGFVDIKPIAAAHIIIKGMEKLKKSHKNNSVTIKWGTSISDKKGPLISAQKKLKNLDEEYPASNLGQKLSFLEDNHNDHGCNNGQRPDSGKTTKGTDSDQMRNRLCSQNSLELKFLEDQDSTDEWDGCYNMIDGALRIHGLETRQTLESVKAKYRFPL